MASSLVELLRLRAGEAPDRRAYTFLLNGEDEEAHVTYGELDRRARAVAARLQALEARGERALLLYPPGLEYVAALFGCFYAGVIAVPAYPPRRNKPDPRLQSIVADCAPTLALTTRELAGEAERLGANTPELAALRWMATEDVPDEEAEGWRDPAVGGDTLAFLQYTSGSTASPKGVMVSHGNLLHNSALIEELAGYTPATRSVIWLPPYHDMGLIGGILQPLFTGYWAALFSPVAFIQRPARWLEAISRYRATSSGGPNFAYELCVHTVRPEEREALDLSRWEIAFNGAEPVRHETLRAFAEAFAPSGFRARALYPCYGLAEATLMVTGSRPAEEPVVRAVDADALGDGDVVADADPEGRYRLVGSGRSSPSQRVIVVDPATLRECGSDRVGEVWVRGPSVAHGYWGRAEATAEAFAGFVAESGEGPFLRTGDLGFLADDGELFITGRLKDLIVIRGRNHYPQDIEMTALRSHPGLRAGSSAAFSVDQDGEERLVVVQEVSRQAAAGLDVEEVAAAVRRAVAAEHGLQVHAVAVVRPGGVPKTTSGKVQRRASRAKFFAGDLPLVGVSVREEARDAAPRPDAPRVTREALEACAAEERQTLMEELLAGHAARALGVDPARVDREQPLVALGMDSLRAMELKGALEASLRATVPISSLLDDTRIDRLAAELLEQLFLADAAAPAGTAPADGEAPLSFAQERLWFLDRLQPGSAAYNIPLALRISGPLDAGALARALAEIVRRHDVLRTVFAGVDGRPVQRVRPAGECPLPVEDVSALPPEDRPAAARRIAEAEAGGPFDLAAGPLLRTRLVRAAADDHLLVVVMHHTVSDGWSAGVVLRELAALYPALLAGEPSPLAPPPARYADWAVRQRESLRAGTLESQLGWWRERLAGAASPELPTDRPRPPVRSFRGATHRFAVPAETADALRSLARAGGATPFMALLAGFHLLLARYSGQDDLAVGTTVSSRDRAEVAGLVGLFVNTLVLRTAAAPDQGFRSLLARVRGAALEAFARQDVPLELLVEELQPERDLSRNPLFQVMIAPQSTTLEPVRVGGATWTPEPVDTGAAILDLTLYTWERSGGGLEAALEYATDLFDAATAERMAAHLVETLRAVAADPDLAVAEVGFLLPEERARVLEAWNRTERPCAERPLHELFAEQAARTPDAAALRFAGRTTTYAELDRSANRLAHHLRSLGVGPEARVGLCVERTPEMVAAMLAILKAGGAYVPLDPAYPAERLEYMLEDAGARLVVSQSTLAERLPSGVARVLVDADAERIAGQPDSAPESAVEAGNLAYVLYTSGSTGRPKGVQVEHRSASQIVHFLRDAVRPEDRAAVLSSTSVSFDVSVGEIFGTICWGGTLVLVENALDLPRVAEEGVRLVVTVPSAAAELLRSGGIPGSVRAFNLAGEALPASLARDLYALPGTERVLNLYGPTEDTVYSTWSEVERGAERVTIGRAVANSRAYVLDPAGSPSPVGVPGELCLAGAGTARGYHGRPDLTAERFVPDAFSAEPGARTYRTGDRARWLAEGEVEYLGRIDQQVKVRGFRIEPGEVEAALRAHPAVGDAVVVARGTGAGGARLVAYHVPAEGAARPAAAELREHLRGRLPDYMVPSAFVALDAFPLTPSGKTDRRALPEPRAEAAPAASAAPATAVEEILAGIWAEVLETGPVGAGDDFFALGGHSLLATRALSRIREALGLEVPLRALFETPTVAGLAARIGALRGGSGADAAPIGRAPRDGGLPLSFAQQRLWVMDRLEPGSPAYNMPGALRVRGAPDVAALRRALGELVRRHEALRTVFAEHGGAPVQVVRPAAPVALPVVDLGRLPGAAAEREALRLAEAEALRPFDLRRGPLLRSAVLRLAEREHVLLVTLHHVVADGWSTDLAVGELSALYAAFARGEPSPLRELPVQYADFAVWQRERVSGERLAQQLEFWRARLAGAPPLLEVPTDRPRAAGQGPRGGSLDVPLPAGLPERLRALSRREGTTLFMTVLAGWQALLGRYAAQEDAVVGAAVAGRSRLEVEELIGCFVNMLVLRTRLDGDPTWRELLGRVRETALGAYDHQEMPFERLVDELGVERSLAHTPLFQAVFALNRAGAMDARRRLGELPLEPFAAGGATVKFDLELGFTDHGDALAGELRFRAALFEAATAARMAGHLAVLLEAMADGPGRRLSETPLLRGAERTQVLEAWNSTAAAFPGGCLHERVAEQAARTPHAAAVVHGAETVTYAELERRADRLARRLRAAGVGPETRVGISVERSAGLLAAILATWKAGGAYVPLDPSYPAERLDYMVRDSGAPLVLAAARTAGEWEARGVRVLPVDAAVDDAGDAVAGCSLFPVPCSLSLAYVIYTSGSTGEPRGVMVSHRSAGNHLDWIAREVLGDAELLPATTRASFDASLKQLVGPLLRGAAVWILPEETVADPSALLDALHGRAGVALNCVPSLWSAVLDAAERGGRAPTGLRRLLLGGEAVGAELVERSLALLPGLEVWNLYGPTEATVNASAGRAAPGEAPGIGRPVANARAYVLDRAGEPVPAGVAGELYVGGAGVARGYLGRPAATAARFVPDALGGEPGARLYRTGDRARWRAGGTLEFLGRADDQVKVRGFRVEPGEIEAALERHAGVRAAVVAAREHAPGQRWLVAYVVPAAGEAVAAAELRSHLAERLPEHMVPGAFVVLDRLPLTPSGKVDRAALPAPERGAAGEGYVAPRTEAEEALCAVWAGLLGLETVGVEDNFFELGGDSILAIQVVSRARQRGLRLTPRQLFERPTVARLAEVVEREPPAAAAAQGPVSGEAPLTPVQLRFFAREHPARHHFNQSLLLRPRERLDAAVLATALATLPAHHDALRLRFRRGADGAWRQAHAEPAPGWPLRVVDLSAVAEDALAEAIRAAAGEEQRGLELEHGPLLRAALFECGAGRAQRLLLVSHHLVVDGVSWRVLLEDLETACAQLARGDAVRLPPRTTSFKAWAEGLAEHARSGALEAEAAYWTERARVPVAPLPLDTPGGEDTLADAHTVVVRLDAGETDSLLREAPRAYRAQADDVLLCALARTLARWTGSPRVRVELEGHGREEERVPGADLSRTVGWFTTLYPVVLDVPADLRASLLATREQLRRVPGRGIGWGLLRHLAGGGAAAGLERAPAAEVAFNYLGRLDASVSGDALFALAEEPAGDDADGRTPRAHRVQVTGAVRGGRLELGIAFGAAHLPETRERVAGWLAAELRALVEHCAAPGAGGWTPGDFPLAGLGPEALDALLGSERGIDDVYPLTPMQEGMLFHTLDEEGQGTYVGQMVLGLRGALDPRLLARAWEGAVERHPALRARFVWEGLDRPLQVVAARAPTPLVREDLRGLAPEERRARLEAYLDGDRRAGLDVRRAPLMRLALFRTEEDGHELVWTHHHLVLDGWSLPLFVRDVLDLYEAFSSGTAARPGSARPHRDYVAWLAEQDPAAAEPAWREALAGFAAPTPLPLQGEPAAGAGARAGHGEARLRLDGARTARLQAFARGRGLTLNTLLQAAWGLLLARWSGEDDVVFGAAVSGRPPQLAGVEETVGMFVNTVPVRVRVRPDAPVGDWLAGLQSRQAALREHEHTPLVRLQRWSEVPAGQKLFESAFAFSNYPVDAALTRRDVGFRVESARVIERDDIPLFLSAAVLGDVLELVLVHHLSRFPAGAGERLLEQVGTLLDQLAAGAGRRVDGVTGLTPDERLRVLAAGRGAATDFPREACVHELIALRAAATPRATAVVAGGVRLDFAELEARAGRLAARLRALGVGPEARVALLLDRSAELAVAVLGVLRAGGAYVPLDPDHPRERLAWLLADSGARVVVTRAALVDALPAGDAATLLVDAAGDPAGPAAPDAPGGAVPDNAAYVIYTSGSTGAPKGVMVSHRSLVCYAEAARAELGLGAGDRFLQFASPGFDVMVEEIFPAWLAGAAVVFPGCDLLESPGALLETVEAQGVTGLELPTAFWHEWVRMLAEEGRRLPASLRFVIVGGERVLPERLAQWAGLGVPLVHVFGLTETTVSSTMLHLAAGDDGSRWSNLPVGHPLADAALYVLDAGMQPVPEGAPGELYLGGETVARGYSGRPALTAEKFVPDPFGAPRSGSRLYRTGDRVRRLAEGGLEFLGRIDQQLKIRGFRIEPGEVEAALAGHPAVREAVVVAREDVPGRRQLVAYVVPAGDPADASAERLRAHLAGQLPAYMVPGAFVAIDQVPLTPNGKIDRRALPAPEAARPADAAAYAAPTTEVERTLCAVWAETLRRQRVGIHDDFFELGGDSILAIQLVSRARRAGLWLRPRQLFQNPTVARLAPVVDAAEAAAAPAEQGAVVGEVELTPIQRWFFEQDVPERHHWNMPLRLELRRPLEAAVLAAALERVVAHHDALRFRYARRADGAWVQSCAAPDAPFALERVELAGVPDEELAERVRERAAAAQAGLDLEHGPLLRALLLEPGGDRPAQLLLVVHHLATDGVSWRILLEDLRGAVEQLARGEAAALPAKTTSFQRWARRLAEHTAGGGFGAELDFWLDGRRGAAPPLPVDFPAARTAANTVGSSRTLAVWLDAEDTRALLQDVPAAYRTQVGDVLLCGLARAFAAWTGEPRLLVDLEGHGREELFDDVDLSRTVGWFTTVYPVLLDLDGAGGEGESLKRVKEQLRAVPGQGIGYGALRWLAPDAGTGARLAALPRAEVAFNHLGQADAALPEDGPFALVWEQAGEPVSPRAPRQHLLEVNSIVLDGRLRVDWSYGEAAHRRETVQALAERFLAELRRLVAHCARPDAGGCTPADFPLADVSQEELDALPGRGRGVEDVYPLSPLQEGLLFHVLYAREDAFYLAQHVFELRGELDAEALRRAWDAALERHPALRAGFLYRGRARPLQVVHRRLAVPFAQEDRRAVPAREREAELERFLAEDRARGFDPERAPLMRVALLRTADDEYRMVWSFLQAVLDGWSVPLLFRDLRAAYEAAAAGREPALAPAPRHRDYVAWVERQDPSRAEAFWRGALAGFDTPTPLPLERAAAAPGPELRTRTDLALSPAETRALDAFARARGLTPGTVVQAAWALLLSRHSGEEDVVFGATVSGRPAELPGVEEMVGVFINTLPLRVRLPGDARVGEWLARMQDHAAELREHEHVALPQVQRWSSVPAGQELFSSIFVFENYPMDEALAAGIGGVEVRGITALEQGNYPLALVALPGERLTLRLHHDPARLGGAAAEGLLEQLAAALEAMAAHPERRLSEVSLLREAERPRLLAAGRAAAPERPFAPVHERIVEQAARTPDEVAVSHGRHVLTWWELEQRSRRLAGYLRGRGVGPEVRVGICLDPDVELVVAALGVLRAGGAYVPLDPDYPADRLEYTLADSGARLLLTRHPLAARLPAFAGETVCLDTARDAIARDPGGWTPAAVDARNAAYLVYTSGSTGRPKGVVVEHAGLAGTLLGARDAFGLRAGDSFPAMASSAFDIWAFEVLAPLLAGGRVRLLDRDTVRDAERLAGELAMADALHAVPALMREVVDRVRTGPGTLPRMRRVFVGGDAVPPDLLPQMQRVFPAAEVRVLYGPTEATILAAAGLPWREDGGERQVVGHPLPGAALYVCDAYGNPQPDGAPGELWIGGAGVARGYLGRPELTAEKFVPDAFGGEPGARLYRTGDRVRRRADGELEFLGRTDTQVKIRGFRVEPGEIEAAVAAHPGVREAVVAVREDVPGQRRLVAYVVPEAGARVGTDELRERLAARLPEHMVPSAFVTLERVPLTPNGKVDRRALPAPERGGAEAGYVAPRTPAEELLAQVWAEVLRLETVGVQDSFFDLGGDSILSIQAVSRARQRGLKLTPRQLFERRTIARLAEVVEWAGAEGADAPGGPVTGPAPLTPVQAAFLEEPGPARDHFNMALLLRPAERLQPALLSRAAAALEAHHDALRLRFHEGADGAWTQEHAAPGSRAPLAVFDLAGLAGRDRRGAVEAAAEQVQRSLDLARGPLLRMGWFDLGAGEAGRLLAVVHHLAVDGVSWRILLEDLETAYGQLSRGGAVDLPARTTSWQSWARRLAEHAGSGALAAEAAFWTRQAGESVAALPVDDAAAANTVARSRSVSVKLSGEETEALLREVPQAYRTQVDEVLLCALAGALRGWTGERRLRVELEGHGREELFADVDLSRTVGWFTSVYPVVLELPETREAGAALKAVKEQLRAVPGRGIGHGLLRHVAGMAELAAAPEAEVAFNYLGQFDQSVSAESFFAFAPESAGSPVDGRRGRRHLLEVAGSVQGGRLQVEIGYAEGVHRRETVERLAEGFAEELRGLIAHCRGDDAGGYTPSDFPHAQLDEEMLALLEEEFGGLGELELDGV